MQDYTLSIKCLGSLFLIIMFTILIYIKPRFGLKPENYKKEDIEFIKVKDGALK